MHAFIRDFNDINKSSLVVGYKLNLSQGPNVSLPPKQP